MTKAVISGYYGYKNFGDEIILSVLVEHLKNLNCEITVLSGDTEYTKEHNNINAIDRFKFKDVLREIKSCDFLISGGGSLLQDATSLKSLIYYLSIIVLGLIFKKKVIIFAQGIGPINNKIAEILSRQIIKLCGYVSVRDKNSFNVLDYWGIKSELLCDPAWSLDVKSAEKKNIVGIQLRSFKTMNYGFLQRLALFVVKKFPNKKVEIFSLQQEQDNEIARKFENIIKKINPETETEIITENITERISELEYMIGMRFHALLIAIKSGVKTCAINYDIKVNRLAKDAKIPIISINASDDLEKIYTELENLKSEDLLRFSETNIFDWTNFDNYILSSPKSFL